jgi:hypothetical protein
MYRELENYKPSSVKSEDRDEASRMDMKILRLDHLQHW